MNLSLWKYMAGAGFIGAGILALIMAVVTCETGCTASTPTPAQQATVATYEAALIACETEATCIPDYIACRADVAKAFGVDAGPYPYDAAAGPACDGGARQILIVAIPAASDAGHDAGPVDAQAPILSLSFDAGDDR